MPLQYLTHQYSRRHTTHLQHTISAWDTLYLSTLSKHEHWTTSLNCISSGLQNKHTDDSALEVVAGAEYWGWNICHLAYMGSLRLDSANNGLDKISTISLIYSTRTQTAKYPSWILLSQDSYISSSTQNMSKISSLQCSVLCPYVWWVFQDSKFCYEKKHETSSTQGLQRNTDKIANI